MFIRDLIMHKKRIKIASTSKKAIKINKFVQQLIIFNIYLQYSKVFWQINSLFELEMYYGRKYMMHCLF